jgi:hypothetical protein
MSESEWTKILGWPGYRVYRSEINEEAKTVRLWVRRKRGNRKLECSGCGRRIKEIAEVYEREVRDLPCFEYRTTVVIELYRLRCPECGIKAEKVALLPSKAPFSKRFEEAVGQACESAPVRRVARSGGPAFAFSHIVRSDGDVQWNSTADFIERVAHVLVEVGVCEKAGAEASVQERSAEDFKLLNPIKPEVVALLENTSTRTSSQDKLDSNEVLQSALAIHEALGSWMQMLFAALEKGGTNKEEATLQMAAMFGKMEQASNGYFPAITSLVMASTLRSYVQYLTTDEGDLNCITPELALVIIRPLPGRQGIVTARGPGGKFKQSRSMHYERALSNQLCRTTKVRWVETTMWLQSGVRHWIRTLWFPGPRPLSKGKRNVALKYVSFSFGRIVILAGATIRRGFWSSTILSKSGSSV